jgi:hypothetical protein
LADVDSESFIFDADEDLAPQLVVIEARKKALISRLGELGCYKLKPAIHSDDKAKTHRDFLLEEVVRFA